MGDGVTVAALFLEDGVATEVVSDMRWWAAQCATLVLARLRPLDQPEIFH